MHVFSQRRGFVKGPVQAHKKDESGECILNTRTALAMQKVSITPQSVVLLQGLKKHWTN